MRLSNTMMINASLLPSSKKAFTLAEVLITLSILGVVAALTIPSLVNRQSEMAAQVKLKKAIANYENVAAVYMVENESTDLGDGTKTTDMAKDCTTLGNYFKIVKSNAGTNGCNFTTSDGVLWNFNKNGNAVLFDSENAPRYGVVVWTKGGVVNGEADASTGFDGAQKPEEAALKFDAKDASGTAITAPTHGYYKAATFMNLKTSQAVTDKGSTTPKAAVDSTYSASET